MLGTRGARGAEPPRTALTRVGTAPARGGVEGVFERPASGGTREAVPPRGCGASDMRRVAGGRSRSRSLASSASACPISGGRPAAVSSSPLIPIPPGGIAGTAPDGPKPGELASGATPAIVCLSFERAREAVREFREPLSALDPFPSGTGFRPFAAKSAPIRKNEVSTIHAEHRRERCEGYRVWRRLSLRPAADFFGRCGASSGAMEARKTG